MKRYTVEEVRETIESNTKHNRIKINKIFIRYEEYRFDEETETFFFWQDNDVIAEIELKDIKEISF